MKSFFVSERWSTSWNYLIQHLKFWFVLYERCVLCGPKSVTPWFGFAYIIRTSTGYNILIWNQNPLLIECILNDDHYWVQLSASGLTVVTFSDLTNLWRIKLVNYRSRYREITQIFAETRITIVETYSSRK